MKILGMGIPELTILLGIPLLLIVIIVIVVLVILKVAGASNTPAPTTPKTPPTITAEEFEQFSKLHEAGTLNQEEFDAIRKRYLGL